MDAQMIVGIVALLVLGSIGWALIKLGFRAIWFLFKIAVGGIFVVICYAVCTGQIGLAFMVISSSVLRPCGLDMGAV